MNERLAYSKVCCVEDFSDPELLRWLRDVYRHLVEHHGPDYPRGMEERKQWEVAMSARALADLGALHDKAEVLGVGAGSEATLFWLTNKVARVFAADLYLASGEWAHTAAPPMLMNPGQYWPGKWNPRRLVAQHMNALDLQYEDCVFDGVFSASSMEHFGKMSDVAKSLDEMFRVLKPGGVLSLSTELRLEGKGPGLPGTLLFSRPELESLIDERRWEPASPVDFRVSERTLAVQVPFEEAAADVKAHRPRWSTYPHLMLRHGDYLFTSIHLAMRKRAWPTNAR